MFYKRQRSLQVRTIPAHSLRSLRAINRLPMCFGVHCLFSLNLSSRPEYEVGSGETCSSPVLQKIRTARRKLPADPTPASVKL